MSFDFAPKGRPIDIFATRAGADDGAPGRWFPRCQWVPGAHDARRVAFGAHGTSITFGHWQGLAPGYVPTGWREASP